MAVALALAYSSGPAGRVVRTTCCGELVDPAELVVIDGEYGTFERCKPCAGKFRCGCGERASVEMRLGDGKLRRFCGPCS